jgi:hypothetical protein
VVYCQKCGTKNEDTAEFCSNCGATLRTGTDTSRRFERRRAESECFGLPNGGAIAAVVIGLIIILWGVLMLGEQQGWWVGGFPFWIVIIVVIGVLMIAGAIYRMQKRKTA